MRSVERELREVYAENGTLRLQVSAVADMTREGALDLLSAMQKGLTDQQMDIINDHGLETAPMCLTLDVGANTEAVDTPEILSCERKNYAYVWMSSFTSEVTEKEFPVDDPTPEGFKAKHEHMPEGAWRIQFYTREHLKMFKDGKVKEYVGEPEDHTGYTMLVFEGQFIGKTSQKNNQIGFVANTPEGDIPVRSEDQVVLYDTLETIVPQELQSA